MRRPLAMLLGSCLLATGSQAQQASPNPTEFIVLRADRVAVPTGESTHLNCSVIGIGDAAQIRCESHTSGSGPSLIVYHVALVVGSNQVGYIVSCGGGLVWRIGCQPLTVGQVLKGTVHGDKISLSVGTKSKTYTVQSSAYIGPLTTRANQSEGATSRSQEESGEEASVKRAAQVNKSDDLPPKPGERPDQHDSPANIARVMFSSEPSGADIYVDGNFVGNTPSQIQLAAGSHSIRIEANGHKYWSREITLTPGGKVTIQAVLSPEP